MNKLLDKRYWKMRIRWKETFFYRSLTSIFNFCLSFISSYFTFHSIESSLSILIKFLLFTFRIGIFSTECQNLSIRKLFSVSNYLEPGLNYLEKKTHWKSTEHFSFNIDWKLIHRKRDKINETKCWFFSIQKSRLYILTSRL